MWKRFRYAQLDRKMNVFTYGSIVRLWREVENEDEMQQHALALPQLPLICNSRCVGKCTDTWLDGMGLVATCELPINENKTIVKILWEKRHAGAPCEAVTTYDEERQVLQLKFYSWEAPERCALLAFVACFGPCPANDFLSHDGDTALTRRVQQWLLGNS